MRGDDKGNTGFKNGSGWKFIRPLAKKAAPCVRFDYKRFDIAGMQGFMLGPAPNAKQPYDFGLLPF